jgi:hypothetical protein
MPDVKEALDKNLGKVEGYLGEDSCKSFLTLSYVSALKPPVETSLTLCE